MKLLVVSRPPSCQRMNMSTRHGITLIELMIAVVLTLVIIAAMIRAFKASSDQITIGRAAMFPPPGPALAWSAVGSGGIADYWKFFPRVEAVVTDDLGGSYTFDSASGPGFARTQEDWMKIESGGEASTVVTLRRSRESGSITLTFA